MERPIPSPLIAGQVPSRRHRARALAVLAGLLLACALPAAGLAAPSPGDPILPLADVTPPTDPVVSGGSLTWQSVASVTVTGSGATDAGGSGLAGYEHRESVNGGLSYGPVTSGASVAVSAEGETVVQFRSVDGAGNFSSWVPATPDGSGTVRIDRTAPSGLTVSGGSLAWQSVASVTVSAAGASDAASGLAGYEHRSSTDGGSTWSAAAAGASAAVSAEGETLVQFRAVDAAGNASAWLPAVPAAQGTVRIDRTAPTAPSVGGGSLAWQSVASILFTASGSTDSGGAGLSGYERRTSTDGGATWVGATAASSIAVTAEDETLVQFRAVDGAGNASAWTPAHTPTPTPTATARIDRTAPSGLSVSGGSLGWQTVAGVTVSEAGAFDTASGLAGVEHRTSSNGGSSWSAPAAGASVTVSAEGETLVQFRATDVAGNASAWVPATPTQGSTVRIDRTPPATPSASGGSAAWRSVNSVTVAGSTSDAGGSGIASWQARLSTDGGASWSPVLGNSVDVVDEGETLVQFRATDAAGNDSAWGPPVGTAAGTVRIDRTGPGNPLVAGGSLAWRSVAAVTVTGSGAADGGGSDLAGYESRTSADGGLTWSAPAAGPSVTVTATGETLVQFRSLDGAGNASAWVPSPSTAGSTVRIDRTAPTAPAVAGGSLAWRSVPSVDITASGSTDSGGSGLAGYEHRSSFDGGSTWDTVFGGASITVSAEGETLVQFRSTDAAGNVSAWVPGQPPAAAAGTARLDRTPPATPAGLTAATPTPTWPALSWTPVGDAVSYRVIRDGALAGTPAGAAFTDTGALVGSHDYRVVAVDRAANQSAPSAVLTVLYDPTADTVAPDTRIVRAPAPLSRNASPQIAFADDGTGSGFQCRIDGGPWNPCTSPATLGPLPDGAHVVAVRARDAVGNVDPTPATASFTVDTTPPAAPGPPGGDGLPLEVTWPAVSDAASYEVGRGGPPYLSTSGIVIGWDGSDTVPPPPPAGLVSRDAGRGAVALSWDPVEDRGEDVVLVARAIDAAGNVSDWSAPGTAHARAGIGRYRVYVDGALRLEIEEASARVDGLGPGPHRVVIVAVDRVGNASAPSAPLSVIAGAPAASTGTSAQSAGVRVAPRVVFARPGASVRLRAAVRGSSAGSPQWTVDGARSAGVILVRRFDRPGRHLAAVAVMGVDGRMATASAVIVIDGTPPVLAVQRVGDRLRVAARDAGSGIARVGMRVDRGSWRPAWHRQPTLPVGGSWVRVRAEDRAGNRRTVRLHVEVTAP